MLSSHTFKVVVCILLYAITAGMVLSLFFLTQYERNDYPYLRIFIILFATVLLTKYFVYMTVSPWHDVVVKWRRRRGWNKGYKPLVSVIVPAWNEEVGLIGTVKSLLKSRYRNLEIVVVNDGSTDDSDKRMREFLASYEGERAIEGQIPIRYYYKENGGKGDALNYGLHAATGEILVTIDADCTVHEGAIKAFVECFRDPNVMGAVGNVKIANSTSMLGTLQYLEFLFSFYFKKADSLLNTIYIVGGAAGAFRREVFDKLGGYSTQNITEDIELSVRMQRAGMRIVYAADAVVYTEGAETLNGLLKQRLRWKRGRFQTFFEHRALFFSSRQEHSKLLSWAVLPLAVFGDLQLFFEPFFLIFLYIYSFLTNDYSSFLSGIMVVSAMFAVQMFDDRSARRTPLLLLAPIGWILFYLTTVVEHQALLQSLRGMLTGQRVHWQRWQRQGIASIKQPLMLRPQRRSTL